MRALREDLPTLSAFLLVSAGVIGLVSHVYPSLTPIIAAIVPRVAIAVFAALFCFAVAIAIAGVRMQGDRQATLGSVTGEAISLATLISACGAAATAVFAHPIARLGVFPSEPLSVGFVVIAIGAVLLTLVFAAITCARLEAGRDPLPDIVPNFREVGIRTEEWGCFVDDEELSRVFERFGAKELWTDELFQRIKEFADRGNTAAQNNVGVMLESGFGVDEDRQAAIEYYRCAAEKGLRTAQFNLAAALAGDILLHGRHVTAGDPAKKLIEAYKWARVAKKYYFPGIQLREFRKHMTGAEVAAGERLAEDWLAIRPDPPLSRRRFWLERVPAFIAREFVAS